MTKHRVVVSEMAQARFFTLEWEPSLTAEDNPFLREIKTMENPQHQAGDSSYWTDTRRGVQREYQGGQRAGQPSGTSSHNYDEHRENNEQQNTQKFAREIIHNLNDMIEAKHIDHVVLCGEKQMIGFLRKTLDELPRDKISLDEVPKDLTKFTPRELHQKLAAEGFLPKRH